MTNFPHNKPSKDKAFSSSLGFAYRVGIEFISGILVGLLLGYVIDRTFDIQPWGLVIMVLVGASAGLLNIFRMLGLWGSKSSIPAREEKDG